MMPAVTQNAFDSMLINILLIVKCSTVWGGTGWSFKDLYPHLSHQLTLNVPVGSG